MAGVQRDGDQNSAGGVAQGGDNSVRINGISVMIPGQTVTPHPPYPRRGRNEHNNGSTVTRSSINSTVKVNGQPIVVDGDLDSCGHTRVGGAADVRIG